MPDVVWITLIIAVLIGITVVGLRLEPHWSSKSGERFICRAQLLNAQHQPLGRWREVRGEIDGDVVVLRTRGLLSRQIAGRWQMFARGTIDNRKRHTYLLRSDTNDQQVALRVPGNSNTVPLLEQRLPD